jgi:hypothetical protein
MDHDTNHTSSTDVMKINEFLNYYARGTNVNTSTSSSSGVALAVTWP